jgi:predicted AlkP superfamily pyrophosphatase or phosphodiesterase
MNRLRFALFSILACLLPRGLVAQPAAPRPYVVLVSLDAFRYDYFERYLAANLLAIARAGAAAKALIPAFPSFTFPNHISIVTGLYPENHGIVENSFYDPARKKFYDMSNMRDGTCPQPLCRNEQPPGHNEVTWGLFSPFLRLY